MQITSISSKIKYLGVLGIIIFGCLLTLSSAISSPIQLQPTVKIREKILSSIPDPDDIRPGGAGTEATEPATGYTFIFFSKYYRMLGSSQAEIIVSGDRYNRFPDDYIYSIKNAGKNHTLLSYDYLSLPTNWDNTPIPRKVIARALYVMDKGTGKSVGYCIMEPWQFNINGPKHNLPVDNIRQLPVDSSFLQGRLQVPAGVTLTHYALHNAGYVERYTLVTYQHRDLGLLDFMLLDAFYPETLEARLEKPMLNYLQRKLNSFGKEVQQGHDAELDEEPESNDLE